ncbi:MAG: hypothetical protein RI902_2248 [Pseudomonadota bacterium]|jgi:hypothetical protein
MTTPQHEHEFEAAPGLPELLPEGEHIVWQAAPDWKQLAIHAFHVRKIAIYFSLMWLLQLAHYLDQGEATAYIVKQCGTSLLLAVVALGLLSISAYYAAQTALYTLTNRRVVMRIGIVLSLTFNVPLRRIVAADLGRINEDSGDIALQLNSADRIAWLHLWPHARAWHVKQPQPTMRCLPDAEKLAHALAQAWQAENPHLAMRQVPRSTHSTTTSTEGVMA